MARCKDGTAEKRDCNGRCVACETANRSRHGCLHSLLRRGRGGEFLEARIIPKRIEHRIEPEQRGSERHGRASGPSYGIESSFCKRGDGAVGFSCPRRDPRPESRSAGAHPSRLSRSGRAAIARSTENAAALSPRPILVSARSAMRTLIFRLFFEERFQFASRLSPTLLGGGVIAGDFLRPA